MYLYSENMHRCQNSRANNVCANFFFKAFDRVCQNCFWRKLGKRRFIGNMRNTLETIYKHATGRVKGANSQLSDLIPKKWSKTRMPIEPSTITFYFRHSQIAKRRRVHWSNTWHISNQLPTVCYHTIVVNLAYRLNDKSNGFQ